MADKHSTNIANGIISGLVLICGIVLSVLVAVLMQRFLQMDNVGISSSGFDTRSYQMYGESQFWAIGFGYIVPGVVGIIVSPIRQKYGYIVQLVIGIITLVVMVILFVLGLILLATLSIYEFTTCSELAGTCVCNNGYRATVTFGSRCADISSIGSLGIGATVMMAIGWFALLAACITGGILACSRNEDTPGEEIRSSQPSVNSMHMGHVHSSQPYIVKPESGYSHDTQSKQSLGYSSGYDDRSSHGYDHYNYDRH